MKWLWRFNVEDNVLGRKFVTMKYGQWISKMGPPSHGVSIWRNIRALWPSFSQNTAIRVGNGRKISSGMTIG